MVARKCRSVPSINGNIFDTFGLTIECEKVVLYRFYMENVDDIRHGSITAIEERTHAVTISCLYVWSYSTNAGIMVGCKWSSRRDLVYRLEYIRDFCLSSHTFYLRDLPLHEPQRETEQVEDYSIFEYQLCPTFDFQQEILWNGEDMERLELLWLRKEIAGKIKKNVE